MFIVQGPILFLLILILSLSFFALVSFSSFVCCGWVTHLMLKINLFRNFVPDDVNAITVVESLKYPIATYHYKVEIVLDFETFDVWLANDDVWIATIFWSFSLNVSKSLRYTKSSRKNSQRPLDIKVFFSWMSCSFSKGLSAINFATSCLNSDFF